MICGSGGGAVVASSTVTAADAWARAPLAATPATARRLARCGQAGGVARLIVHGHAQAPELRVDRRKGEVQQAAACGRGRRCAEQPVLHDHAAALALRRSRARAQRRPAREVRRRGGRPRPPAEQAARRGARTLHARSRR